MSIIPEVKEEKIPAHYKIFRLAKDLEKKGLPVIHLELGDPMINVEREIILEMYKAALMGYTHYGDPRGIEPLREKLAEHLNHRFRIDISKDNISITVGSKFGMFAALKALLKPGDKAILITPAWGLYRAMLNELGIAFLDFKTSMEERWQPSIENLLKCGNNNIRLIIVNNPNNPTSVVLDKDTIESIVEFAKKRGAYILADEVYIDFSRKQFHSFLETGYDKVIALYSFSKSYAMTGFRIGYVVAEKGLAEKISRLLQLYITSLPEFIQFAALKALDLPWAVEKVRRILWERTDFLAKGLEKLGFKFVYPEGAFYVFAKVPAGWYDGTAFCMELLKNAYVSAAPGVAFGDYSPYVRFSATPPLEKLRIALERIKKYLEEHNNVK